MKKKNRVRVKYDTRRVKQCVWCVKTFYIEEVPNCNNIFLYKYL